MIELQYEKLEKLTAVINTNVIRKEKKTKFTYVLDSEYNIFKYISVIEKTALRKCCRTEQ